MAHLTQTDGCESHALSSGVYDALSVLSGTVGRSSEVGRVELVSISLPYHSD